MNETKSLSRVVAVWTAIGIAASMGVYAIFQYLLVPGQTLAGLFVKHLWHVIALAAVIYGVCWFVFQRVLGRPVRAIYLHLYAVGTGRLMPLELETNITEIRTIVEGVNLMVNRMEHGPGTGITGPVEERIEAMRCLLRDLPPSVSDHALPLLDEVAALEEEVRSLVRTEGSEAVANGNLKS